jgi:hypothetical protein
MSDMHSHLRAQRYMEKRLLRASTVVTERPNEKLPAAAQSPAAKAAGGRRAKVAVTERSSSDVPAAASNRKDAA